MANKRNDQRSRTDDFPMLSHIILALLALAAHVVICTYTNASPATSGITIIAIYFVISIIIYLATGKRLRKIKLESDISDKHSNSVVYAFRNSLDIPYAVVTEKGKIITVNSAMRNATGKWDILFNSDISSLCDRSMEYILENTSIKHSDETHISATININADQDTKSEELSCIATIGKKRYNVSCHELYSKGKLYYMLVFSDVTALLDLTELHHDEHTVIAFIVLDNLEEIAQYVKASYQNEARQVEGILNDWASKNGGMLREYDKNKYILVFSRKMLENNIKNKFDILDEVRAVRIGEDNLPVTISVGIATTGSTMEQRSRDALIALDMALQRGGDQVVLKNENGNFFFGGRTKSQQKRTRGHSRIIAGKLCNMIINSPNVLVMGHSNPDFDSIGACVGIATLCFHLGADVKIITDVSSDNFKACTSRLVELSDYKNIFVDSADGLAMSSFGTLLIIVDANNFSILEAPEIAANSFKTAVIDHHIKKEEFEHEPQLSYIDPSASSACEMITEILEQILPVGTLRTEEANILMSGIMVDTKNFTRTVGTRTFAAALYLRSAGASTEYARTFFEEAFDDYRAEAQFGYEAQIYREQIAITAIEGTGTSSDRVSAAKAADSLLSVRNINAAFALIHTGNVVHISARSNGSINVQLILEKIGGGGHFDVAGAAIADQELDETKNMLISAIDQYFEDIK